MYWYVHMRSTWHLLLGTDTGYQVVEGNLVVNKGELQYYDYSIAVSSTSLLALMHVPNLVAAPVWFVRRMYGASYADINMEYLVLRGTLS